MTKYFIWLIQTVRLSAAKCISLTREIGSPKAVFELPDALVRNLNLKQSEIRAILEHDLRTAEGILEQCVQKNIKTLTIDSNLYPPQLREIFSPPVVLYYRGSLPDWDSAPVVSVVGQRKVTPKGKVFTEKLAYELAQEGYIIVSGLAAGVDTAAHRGALKGDGFTVAVLGTGVDICFPKENNGLMRIIADQGLVLSEYPPGTGGSPEHFPQRNRIVSGLSRGVAVTEAQKRSGSLITARCALEQDRDIFACPGAADQQAYEGTNYLVERGAVPLYNSMAIINQYGSTQKKNTQAVKEEREEPRIKIDGVNKKVFDAISQDGNLDYIFTVVEATASEIVRALSLLELTGDIIKINETKYELTAQ